MQKVLESVQSQQLLIERTWTIVMLKHGNDWEGFRADHHIFLDFKGSSAKTEVIIEMDGEQHFMPVQFSKSIDPIQLLLDNQQRDFDKNERCRELGVHLLRIAYDISKTRYEALVRAFFDHIATLAEGEWLCQKVGRAFEDGFGV